MTISIIEKVKHGSDRYILWNWIKIVIYYKQRRNNEELIICLGKEIEPNALILRPKGKDWKMVYFDFLDDYLKNRDIENLKIITHELADWLYSKCSLHCTLDLNQTIAIGFSKPIYILNYVLKKTIYH